MSETSTRMVDPERKPDSVELSKWMGRPAYLLWTRLVEWIEKTYPGVFAPAPCATCSNCWLSNEGHEA